MATFDQATTVVETGGRFQANLDLKWTVNGNPHGGYLLAMLARAAIAADDGRHPHPLSSSAVYLLPPEIGPATVTVESLRRGRTASQCRARLVQRNQARVEALFTLGRLAEAPEPLWVDASPADVAPPAQCPISPVERPGSGVRVEMLDLVEQRLDPVFLDRAPGGCGEIRGWLRFADDTPFDPVSLLYAADSFPPATLTIGSVGWVPTLELTVYVRAIPAAGPLRVRQRVRMVAGSIADQVCEIWDSHDQVVAQATQLALVRMPVRPNWRPCAG